jgi:hypothetical protein
MPSLRAVFLVTGLLGCTNPVGLSDRDELTLKLVENFSAGELPDDAATIAAAQLTGRTLYLTVSYGGGCRTHRFALVTGRDLAESAPPYARFHLAHDADGDPCDAYLTRVLVVDLSPIAPLVQQSGATALRFELVEPGQHPASIGELLLTL